MVSKKKHKSSHERKRKDHLRHSEKSISAKNKKRKSRVKKKVTWDKSIALTKQEFQELKSELRLQGAKETVPLVTFIQQIRERDLEDKEQKLQDKKKPTGRGGSVGTAHRKCPRQAAARAAKSPPSFQSSESYGLRVLRVHLDENGRVDVEKVLRSLGIPRLQYYHEGEPGNWLLLEASSDRKRSMNVFKHGQVVTFRPAEEIGVSSHHHQPDQEDNSNSHESKLQDSPREKKSDKRANGAGAGASSTAVGVAARSSKQTVAMPPKRGSLRKLVLPEKWGSEVGAGVDVVYARPMSDPWKDRWIVPGDSLEDYYGRVSRLIEDSTDQGGGVCGIGIVLRLAFHEKHTRLLLTCRHIILREEKVDSYSGEVGENSSSSSRNHGGGTISRPTKGQLYAFGGLVKILHISKKYDLALLEGPPSLGPDGFSLASEGEEQPGREVRLLTFPWYLDNVWGQLPLDEVQPSQMPGHVAYMSNIRASYINDSKQDRDHPMVVDAIATYMGGLPGCSGGAVTLNSKLLCGVHCGVYPFRLRNGVPQSLFVKEKSPPFEVLSDNQLLSHCHEPNAVDVDTMMVDGGRFQLEGTSSRPVTPILQPPSRKRSADQSSLEVIGSPRFTKCTSSHGYFAVYVSSSHIRETCLEWYAKPRIKKILQSILAYQ